MSKSEKNKNQVSPELSEQNHSGDYAVKKNKSIYMIARVLAFLAAFLLWVYVASSSSTTEEQDFNLIPITYHDESNLKNEYGLIVQSISIDTVNVTLMGNRTDVRSISASDIKAYVSLGDVNEAGEHELSVIVDVPSGITCVAQTVDKVVVSVDKPSTKTVALSGDMVKLSGWSLAKDCKFGEVALDKQEIVLEGPTLALEKVAAVELRTDAIGSATGSFTAAASVHFIDAKGDEILDSGVSVRGGNQLQVSVEVLKTVRVKLVLNGKNGVLSDELVTVSPAHLMLTGEPDLLEGIKELTVGTVDETQLKSDTKINYAIDLDGILIENEAGEPVTTVSANVQVSKLPTRSFDGVPVMRGENVIGYATLTVRAATPEHSEKLDSLSLEQITVKARVDSPEGKLGEMEITFEESFSNAVYAIALSDYRGA